MISPIARSGRVIIEWSFSSAFGPFTFLSKFARLSALIPELSGLSVIKQKNPTTCWITHNNLPY